MVPDVDVERVELESVSVSVLFNFLLLLVEASVDLVKEPPVECEEELVAESPPPVPEVLVAVSVSVWEQSHGSVGVAVGYRVGAVGFCEGRNVG